MKSVGFGRRFLYAKKEARAMEKKPIETNEVYENQDVGDEEALCDAVFVRDGKGRMIRMEVDDDA